MSFFSIKECSLRSKMLNVAAVSSLMALITSSAVQALPFNDDMFHDQYKTGEVMRANPEGSVPRGVSNRWLGTKDEASKLKNPLKANVQSTIRGKRLWEVNCTPCHGVFNGKGFERTIPLTTGLPLGPDVSVAAYKTRSDGYLFATIHFGGLALMPRYGYKLSITEHWDLVNYVRETQTIRTKNESQAGE